MVDFRSSGVPKGGLGIYSATKSLSSPASSSLDKPAGTLSAKTTAGLVQAGQAAQVLLTGVPRQLSDDYPAAARSYAYAGALFNADPLLGAEAELINKFVTQASPGQKASLIEASKDLSIGSQRSILEAIKESDKTATGLFGLNPLLLIGGLFLAYEVFK